METNHPSSAADADSKQEKPLPASTRTFFQEWLEKLQQESWQLELLISGLALYLIWEVRKQLFSLDAYVELNTGGDGSMDIIINLLPLIAWGSWTIFTINLLLHIMARGLWIGAIGLRYVSGDIDFENLNYSDVFTKHLVRRVGRFDTWIEKLERACSVIFAYTFLLFFIFISILIYFGIITFLMYLFSKWEDEYPDSNGIYIFTSLILAYLIFGFIYFIDFVTLGGIKRIKDKMISKIYIAIYLFFSFITLSIFYRPLLYNFIDHRYSRRLLWYSIPYFAIVFLFAPNISYIAYAYFPIAFTDESNEFYNPNIGSITLNWAFYDDQRDKMRANNPNFSSEGKIIKMATVGSFEVGGLYSTLFLRMTPEDDNYLKKISRITPYYNTGLKHYIQDKWADDPQWDSLKLIIDRRKLDFLKRKKVEGDLYSKDVWRSKQDSLEEEGELILKQYSKLEAGGRLKSFQDMFKIDIDSIPYSDSLHCLFYIHPNMGEKGLICYYPVQQLRAGPHQLHIERKLYMETRDDPKRDSFRTQSMVIPFFKTYH